ncbi:MAG: TIGR01777 family oxidoreductase [Crocinitomicaceae bacterium]|nr:TIGR01777 family oxidoreductase [Crocinitomicaceae bacterium]
MKKVVITAANGFMGRNLVDYLKRYFDIVCLVRNKKEDFDNVRYLIWDGKHIGDWKEELEDAYCIINLAGRSVDCRYNDKNKQEIYDSRLKSTEVLGEAIRSSVGKPKLWINASSATIYKHSLDEPMTESDGVEGKGFSVDVCQKWEKIFFSYASSETRQVAIRTAIVLGNDGGALNPLVNLVKFGLGGKQGSGEQMFSWIHIDDFCKSILFILNHKELAGPINLAAPNPVKNVVLMKALRLAYNRGFGIPLPAGILKLGARLIKTETELILKSRFVLPEVLLKAGFEFEFENLDKALEELKQ